MSDKTFSEAEVQALVQAEVAKTEALQEELDKIKNSEEAAAIEARIAEATEAAKAEVAEMQAKLDEAVLMAEAATREKDEVLTWLEDEDKKAKEAAELAARKDERTQKIAEVASFPEDYVAENVDRWAALDDEAFEALLQDYKTVAEKASSKKPEDKQIPTQTAMKAAREENNDNKGRSYRDVFALRGSGIDPRSI